MEHSLHNSKIRWTLGATITQQLHATELLLQCRFSRFEKQNCLFKWKLSKHKMQNYSIASGKVICPSTKINSWEALYKIWDTDAITLWSQIIKYLMTLCQCTDLSSLCYFYCQMSPGNIEGKGAQPQKNRLLIWPQNHLPYRNLHLKLEEELTLRPPSKMNYKINIYSFYGLNHLSNL